MNYHTNYNEPYTDITPLDLLMEKEEQVEEHDDAMIPAMFLTQVLKFILEQNSTKREAIIYGILYALQDYQTLELSTRARAKEIGVSSGTISHYTRKFQKEFDL